MAHAALALKTCSVCLPSVGKTLLSPLQFKVCSHDQKECLYNTLQFAGTFSFILHNK